MLVSALITYLHVPRGRVHGTPSTPKTQAPAACLAAAGLSPVSAPRARPVPSALHHAYALSRSPISAAVPRPAPPPRRSARSVRGSARGRGPPLQGGSHGPHGTSPATSHPLTARDQPRALIPANRTPAPPRPAPARPALRPPAPPPPAPSAARPSRARPRRARATRYRSPPPLHRRR